MSTDDQKFTNGPVVPPLLLRDYREASDALQAVRQDIAAHDERGKALLAQLVEAQAVFNHFEKRIVAKLKLQPDDIVDLETGKVRRPVKES